MTNKELLHEIALAEERVMLLVECEGGTTKSTHDKTLREARLIYEKLARDIARAEKQLFGTR